VNVIVPYQGLDTAKLVKDHLDAVLPLTNDNNDNNKNKDQKSDSTDGRANNNRSILSKTRLYIIIKYLAC